MHFVSFGTMGPRVKSFRADRNDFIVARRARNNSYTNKSKIVCCILQVLSYLGLATIRPSVRARSFCHIPFSSSAVLFCGYTASRQEIVHAELGDGLTRQDQWKGLAAHKGVPAAVCGRLAVGIGRVSRAKQVRWSLT
jgi:hypothetical protein